MRHLLTLLSALCLPFVLASGVGAAVIDFEDGQGCDRKQVVIRAGAAGEPCVLSPNSMDWNWGIKRSSARGDAFWTATFTGPVGNISVRLGDRSSDGDRLFLRAFDKSETLLGESVLDSRGKNQVNHRLELPIAGVYVVRFGVLGDLGAGSGIFADDLHFTFSGQPNQSRVSPIPLPAAGFLLIFAVGASIFLGNRVD